MRFLLSLLFNIAVFAAFLAVFVLPPGQWRGLVAVNAGEWPITRPIANLLDGEETTPRAVAPVHTAPDTRAAPISIPEIVGTPLGDWVYDCEAGTDGERPCIIAHQIADQTTGEVTFSWLIGVNSNGDFRALWQTPTGIMLSDGIVFDAGTERPITLPFTACFTGRCEAVANLAPDFIDILIAATAAKATIQHVSGQTLTFDISVDGLSDAIAVLKQQSSQG